MKCMLLISLLTMSVAMPVLAEAPAPKALPQDLTVLTQKSIFARDRRTRAERPNNDRGERPVMVRRTPSPVFFAVMIQDDGPVALFEDPSNGRTSAYRVGDALPNDAGTIAGITFDELILKSSSNRDPMHIAVGRNLSGNIPEFTAPASSPAATGTGMGNYSNNSGNNNAGGGGRWGNNAGGGGNNSGGGGRWGNGGGGGNGDTASGGRWGNRGGGGGGGNNVNNNGASAAPAPDNSGQGVSVEGATIIVSPDLNNPDVMIISGAEQVQQNSEGGAVQAAPAAQPITGNNSVDIAEQMRRRRQQQMGGR